VAFDLNRLVRETHTVYRGLLALTGTAARVEVISGTSAGGINGAALASAQLHEACSVCATSGSTQADWRSS
jgi:predicted acylesterase/phospholipase RssA